MTREEFQTWRDNPVTQWVLKAMECGVAAQEAVWASCLVGELRPGTDLGMLRNELATRADAYRVLVQTSYEDWCGVLGEEPKES